MIPRIRNNLRHSLPKAWVSPGTDMKRDKGERQALIARPVLNSLADLSGDDGDDNVERVILHSVESVKGLEYENVIFYRFGDIGLNFKELMDKAGQTDINPSEKYTILYHLNRLFIAATRSKSNIYIFDSENLESCWNESGGKAPRPFSPSWRISLIP